MGGGVDMLSYVENYKVKNKLNWKNRNKPFSS